MDPVLGTTLVLGLLLLGCIGYLLSKEKPHDSPWKILAAKNKGLRFQPANPPYTEANIKGESRDCRIELHVVAGRTLLDVFALHPVGTTPVPQLKKFLREATTLAELEIAFSHIAPSKLKGSYKIELAGQFFQYEQDSLEEDIVYLQSLFDLFTAMVGLYPKVLILGGEVAPLLALVAQDDNHLLQPVAHKWLDQIARETKNRLASQVDILVCPHCLVRSAAHEVDLPGWHKIVYYGCRACRQSQEFMEVKGPIIAELDHQMTNKHYLREDSLRINGLAWPTPFDFDQIEIGQTSDEEVERFAVRVANNSDRVQQDRLKEISRWISPEAGLSENTLRVLQRIFGRVEIHQNNRSRGGALRHPDQ